MRYPRLFIKERESVYHIISRTALDGYILTPKDKDYLLHLIYQLSNFYFMDVLAFCIMGNHFHLMVRNRFDTNFEDEEILSRLYNYYPKFRKKPKLWRGFFQKKIPFWRNKMSNLSEFAKDLKQRFSRYYNKEHGRKGYFWGDRFKSVLLGDAKAIRTCMAYIDLNPVRANMVQKPEEYPWSSVSFRCRKNFYPNLLSNDLYFYFSSLEKEIRGSSKDLSLEETMSFYLKYLYNKGTKASSKGKSIDKSIAQRVLNPEEDLSKKQKYLSEGLVLGGKSILDMALKAFKGKIELKKPRKPKNILPGEDFFSLKGSYKGKLEG